MLSRSHTHIFIALFVSILASITGVGIVVPLLPVYAKNLGASGFYIGMIFGIFSISRTILLPVFGRWSDRVGRKPFIVAGLLAYIFISLAFIVADTIEGLLSIRFFHGMASAMIVPVAQAYVGDITPPGKEGFIMGVFNLSMFLSLSLGPVLGGIIHDAYGLNMAYGAMAVLSFVSFLMAIFFLPSTRDEPATQRKSLPVSWHVLLKDRSILGLFLFRMAYTTCIGVIWCFLPVYADTEFNMPTARIGILVMMGVLVSGLLHTPMGYLADRVNKKVMVLVGGAGISVAMAALGLADGFWQMLWVIIGFGFCGGIAVPAQMAIAVIIGREVEAMGTVMALMTMAHSMGMLAGSLIAGATMDFMDLKWSFPMGALMMALGTILFIALTMGVNASVGRAAQKED